MARTGSNKVQSAGAKKAPSENPVAFYKGEARGGAHGSAGRVPDKLTGGPMREQVYGRKSLSRS